jgi:hypothetical protein
MVMVCLFLGALGGGLGEGGQQLNALSRICHLCKEQDVRKVVWWVVWWVVWCSRWCGVCGGGEGL